MHLRFSFLLLFSGFLAACKTAPQKDNSDTPLAKSTTTGTPAVFKWVFYDYGEPLPVEMAKAQTAVWAKYGVSIEGFGCVVTDGLVRDVKLHNDSLFALLQPKYPGLTEDRILGEMQNYVTTQKSIEGTIKPYLKKVMKHCVEPYYYPNIEWQPADTTGKVFLVKVFLEEPKSGDRQPAKIEMKVMPATGDYLVQNAAGTWVEQ